MSAFLACDNCRYPDNEERAIGKVVLLEWRQVDEVKGLYA